MSAQTAGVKDRRVRAWLRRHFPCDTAPFVGPRLSDYPIARRDVRY